MPAQLNFSGVVYGYTQQKCNNFARRPLELIEFQLFIIIFFGLNLFPVCSCFNFPEFVNLLLIIEQH